MPVYVQHEILRRIPDVFNAEALWQAPGLALFSRRPLLRDLLERSPREHRGRAATRCFTHVTLMLPQEDVDDDYHLSRGARARDLAQSLASLHQKDFGDLLGGDPVRYHVVGTEALAAGEVEVRFGHAVYLPEAGEKVLYNVSISRDSAVWHPVCPIYPAQRLVLLGAAGSEASHIAAGWPFGPDSTLLILNDGPDSAPVVQMRPKDGYQCSFDPRSGYYTIKTLPDMPGTGTRLLVKISRSSGVAAMPSVTAPAPPSASASAAATVSAAALAAAIVPRTASSTPSGGAQTPRQPVTAASKPAVWQGRQSGSNGRAASIEGGDATAIPASQRPALAASEGDATYAPTSTQRISLVALALPRLSRYRDTGALALALPFNRQMALAAGPQPVISFMVDANDELSAASADGRQRISAPATFTPLEGYSMQLLAAPAAMADRYCALLGLPRPLSVAAPLGARFNFGRNSPVLAALRVLASAQFLQRSGVHPETSADRIGLSRNAFSFEATARGYLIGRLSASQALYHLDDKLVLVASIDASDAETPYLLPRGHHLVAGPYVLRFDA